MNDKKHDEAYYADIISAMAERTIKRLWAAILILSSALVGTIGYGLNRK